MEYWMGIDVSRLTLEVALTDEHDHRVGAISVKNEQKSLCALIKRWMKEFDIAKDELLICLEPTSHYSNGLLRWLVELDMRVWLAHPNDILHSIGSTRGKSDRVDALRIAQYARRFRDKTSLFTADRLKYNGLRQLITRRNQLVRDRVMHQKQISDLNRYVEQNLRKAFDQLDKSQVRAQDKRIAKVDGMILDLIRSLPELQRLYSLLLSVPGVGPVLAANLLAVTEGFSRYNEPRALSCHAGSAPYEHSSGSSVRGRTRVSPQANKGLKTLLHISALGCITREGELKDYWTRKCAEGKPKMSILNAIRNKIIHRVCAVVKRGQPYTVDYPLQMG
jgi:transposase